MGIGQPVLRHPAVPSGPLAALLGLVLLILGLMGMHTVAGHHAGTSKPGFSLETSAASGAHQHFGPADHSHLWPASSSTSDWEGLDCPGCCSAMPQAPACDLAPVAGNPSGFFLPVLLVLPGDLGLRAPPPASGATDYIPPPPSLIELSISRT